MVSSGYPDASGDHVLGSDGGELAREEALWESCHGRFGRDGSISPGDPADAQACWRGCRALEQVRKHHDRTGGGEEDSHESHFTINLP